MNSSEEFSPNDAHPPAPGNDRLYKGIMTSFPPSSPNMAGCFPGGNVALARLGPFEFPMLKKHTNKQTSKMS